MPAFGSAAEYPVRPIRYVVHSAAGGSADTHVRVFTRVATLRQSFELMCHLPSGPRV